MHHIPAEREHSQHPGTTIRTCLTWDRSLASFTISFGHIDLEWTAKSHLANIHFL